MCEAENTVLTIIDDKNRVCEECFLNDFYQCCICNRYWNDDDAYRFIDRNNRYVCEYCAKDFDGELFNPWVID